MSSEIEIEFKNIVTESEFEHIKSTFSVKDQDFHSQDNYYFDTPSFLLREKSCALRIRHKKDVYELTLKQPADVGLLETNEIITPSEFNEMISIGKLPNNEVRNKLEGMNIPLDDLTYFGCLTTKRAEKKVLNGLLVFDISSYLTVTDYEIEYEVTDYHQGKKNFHSLMNQLNIPIRKTDNKIVRFYKALF